MLAQYYGWDVGGAHLKFAALGAAGEVLAVRQVACPMWQGGAMLSDALAQLVTEFGLQTGVHAISMTAELCDVFATRAAGVAAILAVLEAQLGGTLWVYRAAGWSTVSAARDQVEEVASMNWHATAAYSATLITNGWLVDIGSTTTDLIPLRDGQCAARGFTDATRMTAGELVYTGVCRTPVMAVSQRVPWRGHWRGLAAEFFANMADVYRITGELPRGADLYPTADQRPADLVHSLPRLARMLGEDTSPADHTALHECARFLSLTQLVSITDAMALVESRIPGFAHGGVLIGAGVGQFLARRLALIRELEYLDFAELAGIPPQFNVPASHCAPAIALARLAALARI